MSDSTRLHQILALIDLTSLNDAKDDNISALCAKASTPYGKVAAVCSWAPFTAKMKTALNGLDIPVAVVINFPTGDGTIEAAVSETKGVVSAGADEIDLVWPYNAWQAGRCDEALEMIRAVKHVCGGAKLKVILESGAFDVLDDLGAASRAAIAAGADTLKTSTGKIAKGASLDAARVMLEAIKESGQPVGFKASGGIRTPEDAEAYLTLAEEIMGNDWPTPKTFRIGASSLLDALLESLECEDR